MSRPVDKVSDAEAEMRALDNLLGCIAAMAFRPKSVPIQTLTDVLETFEALNEASIEPGPMLNRINAMSAGQRETLRQIGAGEFKVGARR